MSPNFSYEELTASEYAQRQGLDNTPSSLSRERLEQTAKNMETVRTLLDDKIITVNSGYRSPTLNRAIGGSATSAHCLGYAVDFSCHGFGTPHEIVQTLKDSELKYDQLIYEGTWVHISFDPRMRQQTLVAHFGRGKTTYSEFV